MIIPILRDRTEKPPLGTPLRSDGHWSVHGLVGAWGFNEGAGAIVANAIDGKQKTLAATDVTVNGLGLAFSDNAASATVQLADAGIVDFTKPFVCLAHVNKLGIGSSAAYPIFSKYVSSGSGVTLGLNNSSGTVKAYHRIDGAANTVFGSNIGTAYPLRSIAFTYDGSQLTVFYNGIADSAASVSPSNPNTSFRIGPNFAGASNLANTVLSTFLYQRALSSAEIASLSANPWQAWEPEVVWAEVGGGGLSSVASSLALPWDIFATVVSDLSIKWDLLNSVQSDLSIRWDVLNTVFAGLSVKWDAFAQVNGDITIVFDTRNMVTSDLAVLWDSAGTVFSGLKVKWDLGEVGGRITIIGSSFRRFIQ